MKYWFHPRVTSEQQRDIIMFLSRDLRLDESGEMAVTRLTRYGLPRGLADFLWEHAEREAFPNHKNGVYPNGKKVRRWKAGTVREGLQRARA